MYRCAECNGKAEVVDGQVQRECGHDTAGVLADLSAHCTGESKTRAGV